MFTRRFRQTGSFNQVPAGHVYVVTSASRGNCGNALLAAQAEELQQGALAVGIKVEARKRLDF